LSPWSVSVSIVVQVIFKCCSQLIRIRSKDGNFRFELEPTATALELAEKVIIQFTRHALLTQVISQIIDTTKDADPSTICISERPRGGEVNINTLTTQTLKSLGLK